jgi:folate-binding protein YgfZ
MSITFSTPSGFFEWSPAAWLRVTGPDALSFLQGQFSQDLRPVAAAARGSEPAYGLWLTLKGKVEADGFVFRGESADEFWIGSYFSRAPVIRARLEGFIIADDVTIEDQTDAWTGITWVGEAVGSRLDTETVERARIAARIPAVPVDAGPGDLPNEADLDATAVSYTKGCYLGQEVMARLKAMGQVRRRLVRVGGIGSKPIALPAAVFKGERQVGEVRSAVADGAGGWLGLAMVSNLHTAANAELAFSAGGASALRLLDAP